MMANRREWIEVMVNDLCGPASQAKVTVDYARQLCREIATKAFTKADANPLAKQCVHNYNKQQDGLCDECKVEAALAHAPSSVEQGRAREALEFYADRDNWKRNDKGASWTDGKCQKDRGAKAKAALARTAPYVHIGRDGASEACHCRRYNFAHIKESGCPMPTAPVEEALVDEVLTCDSVNIQLGFAEAKFVAACITLSLYDGFEGKINEGDRVRVVVSRAALDATRATP